MTTRMDDEDEEDDEDEPETWQVNSLRASGQGGHEWRSRLTSGGELPRLAASFQLS